jgi:NADPH2:quinone reductase
MRCISYSKFGPASEVLKVTEVSTPEPKDGEVLVRLHFSGANPSDAKARAGNRPGVTKPQYELVIPNSDGSGIITAVGKGVDTGRVGEKVWIWNGQWHRPYGTAADFIALPSEQAVQIPIGMSLETGACLGIPGLTAAHCTLGDGSLDGKTVLISGGCGSVGNISIQLAKWSGAQVISTGSTNGFSHIYDAGADHVFDYGDPELTQKNNEDKSFRIRSSNRGRIWPKY